MYYAALNSAVELTRLDLVPWIRQTILEEHSDRRQGHLLVVPAQGFTTVRKLGLLDIGMPLQETKPIKQLIIGFEERKGKSCLSCPIGISQFLLTMDQIA